MMQKGVIKNESFIASETLHSFSHETGSCHIQSLKIENLESVGACLRKLNRLSKSATVAQIYHNNCLNLYSW